VHERLHGLLLGRHDYDHHEVTGIPGKCASMFHAQSWSPALASVARVIALSPRSIVLVVPSEPEPFAEHVFHLAVAGVEQDIG
jgi:hypothetical protein